MFRFVMVTTANAVNLLAAAKLISPIATNRKLKHILNIYTMK